MCSYLVRITCLVYLPHADLLSKNLIYDLDLTIANILRFEALAFCEVH